MRRAARRARRPRGAGIAELPAAPRRGRRHQGGLADEQQPSGQPGSIQLPVWYASFSVYRVHTLSVQATSTIAQGEQPGRKAQVPVGGDAARRTSAPNKQAMSPRGYATLRIFPIVETSDWCHSRCTRKYQERTPTLPAAMALSEQETRAAGAVHAAQQQEDAADEQRIRPDKGDVPPRPDRAPTRPGGYRGCTGSGPVPRPDSRRRSAASRRRGGSRRRRPAPGAPARPRRCRRTAAARSAGGWKDPRKTIDCRAAPAAAPRKPGVLRASRPPRRPAPIAADHGMEFLSCLPKVRRHLPTRRVRPDRAHLIPGKINSKRRLRLSAGKARIFSFRSRCRSA
jgi:hypothetical protein